MPQHVSVIIPLYNHASYIREAVKSVLAEGSVVAEIIVIDDGSTDNSYDVMQEIVPLDRRIVCWTQPNRGAHSAINAGLYRATSESVAILNSDDAYVAGRLVRLIEALDLDDGADMAASSIRFVDDVGVEISNQWHADALASFKARGDLGLSLMNSNFLMTTSNFVFRRRLIDEIGAFAPLRYAHDLDFGLRAAALGHRLAFIDEPLLSYRMHAANTIKEDHTRVRREWALAAAHFIHLMWAPVYRRTADWKRLHEAFTILDSHSLARAVDYCLFYFRRYPTDSLEHSRILTDREFNEILVSSLA